MRNFRKILLLILGISPLILIYAVNPKWRFFSAHGLMHTAIVYQIGNGTITPNNPFLGGEPLYYNWGYHSLAALLTRVLNLAPSYSFALINIISLVLAMILVYKISRQLVKNEWLNVLSVIIAIFGFTIFSLGMLIYFNRFLATIPFLF